MSQTRAYLSDAVAEEIRAVMGRKKISGAELGRRLKMSSAWVSYRLSGKQEIGLDDLQHIAEVLEVDPKELVVAAEHSLPAAA